MPEGKGEKKEGRYEEIHGRCSRYADLSAQVPINRHHILLRQDAAGEGPLSSLHTADPIPKARNSPIRREHHASTAVSQEMAALVRKHVRSRASPAERITLPGTLPDASGQIWAKPPSTNNSMPVT